MKYVICKECSQMVEVNEDVVDLKEVFLHCLSGHVNKFYNYSLSKKVLDTQI